MDENDLFARALGNLNPKKKAGIVTPAQGLLAEAPSAQSQFLPQPSGLQSRNNLAQMYGTTPTDWNNSNGWYDLGSNMVEAGVSSGNSAHDEAATVANNLGFATDKNYLKGLGFTGNATTPATYSRDSGGDYGISSGGGMSPELQQWMQSNGYTARQAMGENGGSTGIFDKSNKLVGDPYHFDPDPGADGWAAAALAMMGGATAGIASAGGFGGGLAGAGAVEPAGGLSGMDLAADAAIGTGNNITTAGGLLGGAPSAAAGGLSGMDLAADAPLGAGNNITTAAGQFSGAAPGAGSSIANTGSDAHFYQPQAGGVGVQDLGNMGGASGGAATLPTLNLGGGSSMLGSIGDWIKANPGSALQLGSMLGGAVAGKPSGGSGSGYTPQPVGSGGWQSSVATQQMKPQQSPSAGLLANPQGQVNDGLWRYNKTGLLG